MAVLIEADRWLEKVENALNAKDIFSIPHGNWVTHRCAGDTATLFVVTDREVLRRLDLLIEEYGNEKG